MFCLLNNPLFIGVLKIHIFKYPASCAVIFSDHSLSECFKFRQILLHREVIFLPKWCIVDLFANSVSEQVYEF